MFLSVFSLKRTALYASFLIENQDSHFYASFRKFKVFCSNSSSFMVTQRERSQVLRLLAYFSLCLPSKPLNWMKNPSLALFSFKKPINRISIGKKVLQTFHFLQDALKCILTEKLRRGIMGKRSELNFFSKISSKFLCEFCPPEVSHHSTYRLTRLWMQSVDENGKRR